MGYKRGQERDQLTLLPEAIDDFVSKTSYVRFIDSFVASFDFLELGFKHGTPAETGRPAYDPADLLKLYIYGSMNRLNSSRQLAHACKCNVEVMWLLRRIQPDFRTISDFRKDNPKPIRKLFVQFIRRMKAMGLVVGEMVGIDGSKFAANNSKDNNYTAQKLEWLIERYTQQMKRYLHRLEQNDSRDTETPALREQLQEQMEITRLRQEEKQRLLEQLREHEQKQISIVDPDSRRMKSGDGTVVGYNVQATVDAEHKLIVDVVPTNSGNDSHELKNMTSRAKDILQQETLKAAADTGYYRAEEIAECEKDGIETYISKPRSGRTKLFNKTDFIYNKDENIYVCPAGEKLTFRGKLREHGRLLLRYEASVCQQCPLRSKCTTLKKGNRRVTRFIDEDLLDKVQERSDAAPHIRTLRKAIVEHPFGTLKRRTNGRFLTRGLFKVDCEAVLMVIAYNLGRVFNILGGNLPTLFSPA
jgi:transposase